MSRTLDATAKGVFPISVTPFLEDGSLDLESMDRLADWFVDLGVPGVTLLGVMGEAVKLSEDESLQLVRRVVKRVAGKLAVIVGVSQGGYQPFSAFARAVMDAGASGIMVSPPPGLKSEEHVIGHFDGLIRMLGGDVPIVLQDYPQLSGVFLSVATVERLITSHPSIVVLKHEEGSAMRKISRLRASETAGSRRRISILVGNSGIHLPQELQRGADGANTGVAFPEMLIEVCRQFAAGQQESAEDLYDIFLPLIRHEQQPGIGLAIRKEVFRRRGLISSARARSPGPSLDRVDQDELSRLLSRLLRRLEASGETGLIRNYPLA